VYFLVDMLPAQIFIFHTKKSCADNIGSAMWTAGTTLGCADQVTYCFHNTLPTQSDQFAKRMKGRGECVGIFTDSENTQYKVLFPCEKKLYLACESANGHIKAESTKNNVSNIISVKHAVLLF
jgi:hypothetical protein